MIHTSFVSPPFRVSLDGSKINSFLFIFPSPGILREKVKETSDVFVITIFLFSENEKLT